MPCLECDLHGLKADPSARADDEDCRHGVMLPVGPPGSPLCALQAAVPQDGGGLNCISRRLTFGKSRPPRSHPGRYLTPSPVGNFGRDERGGANGGTATAAKADSPNRARSIV